MIDISNNIEDDFLVISLDGEVDASSSIHLDKAIDEAVKNNHKKILVDGSKLSYISSAGLGVFMSYIQDFDSQGIKLILFGLSEKVKNVFQILGLDQLLKICESKEEAKQLF
ncbi:STAS domain-containing protein [Fulvivirgaceae bacterium BMA10]|uniref:Anti-sigma factor antagonist n=1 Tax=Splendidivirga corallicola TaxID=3051826 RepID=A0ABT8KTD6_9BACT|nr:STAS domain-containing protein [Fulvivirgaceae bacterium BMA10]